MEARPRNSATTRAAATTSHLNQNTPSEKLTFRKPGCCHEVYDRNQYSSFRYSSTGGILSVIPRYAVTDRSQPLKAPSLFGYLESFGFRCHSLDRGPFPTNYRICWQLRQWPLCEDDLLDKCTLNS
ncbi:uncharacterized protein PV06_06075 [Exophiala oligosperma]|uniref:Uncharacterized protein n=1 Tax=Exophiala oligosperma TaxID=215243 RepID=A0A0D2E444_9EURO|nr:uncharacterized protein PV06_06075 [Exophiala oligosperma]KIW42534.1 hypothetical protein PV06_06075 [Exophiala oligosperma]